MTLFKCRTIRSILGLLCCSLLEYTGYDIMCLSINRRCAGVELFQLNIIILCTYIRKVLLLKKRTPSTTLIRSLYDLSTFAHRIYCINYNNLYHYSGPVDTHDGRIIGSSCTGNPRDRARAIQGSNRSRLYTRTCTYLPNIYYTILGELIIIIIIYYHHHRRH